MNWPIFYISPLTDEQLRSLATMLEELQGAGLGWDHPYVQCRVQGTLFSLERQTPLPPNLCANLAPLPSQTIFDPTSALAFVRFTPPLQDEQEEEEQLSSKYYYPPLKKELSGGINTIFRQLKLQDRHSRHDPMELAHFEKLEEPKDSPLSTKVENVMDVFKESERNRLQRQQEQREAEFEAERKNALGDRVELYQMLAASEPDPQPYQRNPPPQPVLSTAPLNAFDKLQRIVDKNSPYLQNDFDDNEQFFPEHYMLFKRLNPNRTPKERSFFRELAAKQSLNDEELHSEPYNEDEMSTLLDSDTNWLESNQKRISPSNVNVANFLEDKVITPSKQDLLWKLRENSLIRNSLTPFQQEAMLRSNVLTSSSKQNQNNPEHIFTEAGLVYVPEAREMEEMLTDELKKDEARELLENMLGFKRRERFDVKKPGPLVGPLENSVRLENKTGHTQANKTQVDNEEVLPVHIKTNQQMHHKKNVKKHSDDDHAPHSVDTSYAHVYVKNPIDSWNDGVRIMNELANILHMQGYFTYLT